MTHTSAAPSSTPASATDTPGSGSGRRRISGLLVRQEASLVGVIVVIAIATSVANPSFLQPGNLIEILSNTVIYFVMGCGAAILVIGGGLDFSVGAVFTLSALAGTAAMRAGLPVLPAILLALVAAAGVGAVNFVVITYLHVPPIIATLGVFFVTLGIDQLMTGGDDVLPLPEAFTALGQGTLAGVPVVVLIAIVVGLVFWFLLEHTRFGINTRALGGNRTAAIGNGIRVQRLDLALYVIAAVTGGMAGLIFSARVGAGQVDAGGATTTLSVVTAVLIGGISLLGGLGSITGVAVGALLLSVIDNAVILAGVPPQYNNIVIGAILVGAVAVDYLRRKRLYRKR